jgi:hypothetical protein
MIRGLVVGIAGTLAVLALLAYAAVKLGAIPANADAKPPAIERWAARTSLHAALARGAPRTPNPVPLTDENLIAGIKT